jgi:hypothetical protein
MPKAVRKATTIKNVAPDAELIAMGRRISELRAQERASDAECRALLRAKDDAAEALAAAEARSDAIGDEMSELYDRMLELKPTTLEGYRAFALALVQTCWSDEIVIHGDTGDWKGIAAIVSGLAGITAASEIA